MASLCDHWTVTTGSGSATRGKEPSALRRLVFLGLAVAAGVALSVLAPEDWESGPGNTTVTYRGEIAIVAPITVGSTEPVS